MQRSPPQQRCLGPLSALIPLLAACTSLTADLPAQKASVPSEEETALTRAQVVLADKGRPLSERLQEAETILTTALRSHLSAPDRPVGRDHPLMEVRARLKDKLLEVRRQELVLHAAEAREEKDWTKVFALADRLAAIYPQEPSIKAETADLWARYAEERLKAGDPAAARVYLERLDRHFLDHPRAQALSEKLERQAQALVQEARSLKDRERAVKKLQEAQALWPRLPGLRDEVLKAQGTYPILYVGVRGLPEQLSPATAWTGPEKQALELLFERLLSEEYDEDHGERFRPDLVQRQPEIIPSGRRFRLKPDARWSDGKRVTALDVRHTLGLLQGSEPDNRVKLREIESDLFHLEFRLLQGSLLPLASLTFQVLPQTLDRADAPEFARAPVGSGPYRYAGRKQEAGRTCAVFLANPYYYRADHPDRPHIREIRMFVSTDPARDFRDPVNPLHLLLDLPTERISGLQRQGVRDIRTLENRRVYFLALNHRVPALGNEDLRRALAHGLDRERILTERFRGGSPAYRLLGVTGAAAAAAAPLPVSHPEFHHSLNGPYPPRSWACAAAKQVPPTLYDLERARFLLRKANVHKVELTLKYPNDDPRLARACSDIARQLGELGTAAGCPIQIRPMGLPPRELRQALERREYEMAYHHYDYASEAYWLWPLFDSRPGALDPGGSNYLGYQNDGTLETLFRDVMSHRRFKDVQEITHSLHAHLYARMPLIPLWQLDTHVGVHPDLTPAHLDPLRVFTRAAEWQLQKK